MDGELVIEPVTEVALDELVELYDAVGWSVYTRTPALLRAAIAGSSYVVAARCAQRLVGLARAVSDDATVCYLQDVLWYPRSSATAWDGRSWRRCWRATRPESVTGSWMALVAGRLGMDKESAERLWQHLLHEEDAVVHRGNFFLVAESLLVVGYSSLVAAAQGPAGGVSPAVAARAIAGFGLLVTIVWLYVGRLQLERRRYVRERCIEQFAEYRDFATKRRKGPCGVSGLMTFVTPVLAARSCG